MPFYTSRILALGTLTLGIFGCVGAPESTGNGVQPATAGGNTATLPPASPTAFRLPWSCGRLFVVNQGNHGDECGVLGNHLGVEEYAWDFGLPLRTPVLASRAGVVTLAETPSPPGSQCYGGCPSDTGGSNLEQQACCVSCLFSANKVNVEHSDGTISSYSHLDEVTAQVGQTVQPGDLLGYSGTSGCSTGPHLHFQVMTGCPDGYCQSVPLSFDEAGVPKCGDKAISANACG